MLKFEKNCAILSEVSVYHAQGARASDATVDCSTARRWRALRLRIRRSSRSGFLDDFKTSFRPETGRSD